MTRPIRYFIALALILATLASAWAGDCRRTAATCVDATPCKNISGYNVCLANIGISCWKYEDTYECVKPDTVDYCAAIAATPGCNVTNSVCQSTAFNGTCLDYKKTYRCGNPITPAAGVVQLENSYTIVYDQINTAPCASYSSNPSCQLSSKVCIDGPATKNINGLDVYKACWQWKEDYNCIVSNPKDYCEPLKQAGCNKQSEVCTKTAFTGECIEKKFNYICEEEAGDPLPTNVVYLDTTYTIVSDTTNNEMCDAFDNNPNCTLSSSTCIDGPGTKNINGLDVYKDCWQWKKDYSCAATELTSTCQELQNNPNCTETDLSVSTPFPAGRVACWSISTSARFLPRRRRHRPIAAFRRSASTAVVSIRGIRPMVTLAWPSRTWRQCAKRLHTAYSLARKKSATRICWSTAASRPAAARVDETTWLRRRWERRP